MSYFKTELETRAVARGWVLTSRFVYHSDLLSRDVVVPRSFFTDLASVPRLFRFIVPVANAKNRKAAVVHDFLCHKENQINYKVSQAMADKVFLEALGVCGVARWKAKILYNAVRAFQLAKHRTNYWRKP